LAFSYSFGIQQQQQQQEEGDLQQGISKQLHCTKTAAKARQQQ
jgi:hypothetical protein